MWLVLFSDQFLPLPTLLSVTRACCLMEHLPSSPVIWLPIGFDQQEALAGDWKAGGRKARVLLPTLPLVVSLLGAESLLWLQFQ